MYLITFFKALASVLGVAGQMMGNLSESEEEGQGRAQVSTSVRVNLLGESSGSQKLGWGESWG